MRRQNPNPECQRLRAVSKNLKSITKENASLVCYFCFTVCSKQEIKDWVNDDEALCPTCEMNSIIPADELSDECPLEMMKAYWFDGGIQLVVEDGLIKDVINVNNVYVAEDFEIERKALIGIKISEVSP